MEAPLDDFEKVLLATSTLDKQELLDLKALFAAVSSAGKAPRVSAKQAAHTLAQLGFVVALEGDGTIASLPGGKLGSLDVQEFLQVASRCSEDLSTQAGSGSDKDATVMFRMLAPHNEDTVTPAHMRDFLGCSGVPVGEGDAEKYCRALSRSGSSSLSRNDLKYFTARQEARLSAAATN